MLASHRLHYPFLLLALAPGCAISLEGDSPDGRDRGPGGKADDLADCQADGRYGDGACDVDCSVSDIDCFLVFDDQAAASDWWAGLEEVIATSEAREPRAVVPATDPRFPRMRELLDRGWDAYLTDVEMGDLQQAPELVLLEDPSPNAFMARDPETEKSAWAVVVHTGMLDLDRSDAELLALALHELEHGAQLHTLPAAADRIGRHYQLTGGPEAPPFGFERANDPVAEAAIEKWVALANEASPFPLEAFNGLPFHPSSSMLRSVWQLAHRKGRAADPAACARADELSGELSTLFGESFSHLALDLILDAEAEARLDSLSREYLEALETECLAGASFDIVDLVSELIGASREVLLSQMDEEEKALLEGRHVVEQITAFTELRHQRMRDIEQALLEETGYGLESLRYFSTEDAADVRTVPVMLAAGFPGDALAGFLSGVLLPAQDDAACQEIRDRGEVPPYGNLFDDHHATCWRSWHVETLLAERHSDDGAAYARREVVDPARRRAAERIRSLPGATLPELPSRIVVH